jgi:hypothetical protein
VVWWIRVGLEDEKGKGGIPKRYTGGEGNGGSDFRGAEKEKKEDGWQRKLPRTPIKVGGS